MPGKAAFAWLNRIKAVEREFRLAQLAVDRFRQQAMETPAVLAPEFEFHDVSTVADQLEGTYLVRLFSEFETALRHYLRAERLKQPSRTEVLVNKVRDRVNIPDEQTEAVHSVREYRNALVHDVEATVDPVEMHDATRYLSTFLSWLQRTW